MPGSNEDEAVGSLALTKACAGDSTDPKAILDAVKASGSSKVKVAIVDIDGVLRGKVIHLDKFSSIIESGFGFCDVVLGWDVHDSCYDNISHTGWHTGYPDAHAVLDLSTFRQIPWDDDIPFFLADFKDDDSSFLDIAPRTVLRTLRQQCLDLGYVPIFSQEFEWFNFSENSHDVNERQFTDLLPLSPGMFGYSVLRASQHADYFNDLFDTLAEFRVPLEGLHTETGPGVYEAAILHSDILEAADRACLFKSAVKEIGHRHDVLPTFMAKWNAKLPGCSGHIHQSLWSPDKKTNLFYDSKDALSMSPLMRQFLAGQLHCLPHILPMYAPTINSYKRLVEGHWAPTTITWGIDNRTVAIRALPLGPKATRLEFRVSGADVNPYLAMTAALASGLYGIRNKLPLDIPQTIGNGYEDKSNGILPTTLQEATLAMKESVIANELFGKNFVNHFARTREWEWRQHLQAVTDWEFKRYFEII